MPHDVGVYESNDALVVDRFECFGGRTAQEGTNDPVVVGVFGGIQRGFRRSSSTVMPAEYALQVADQIVESAKEALR